MKLEPKSKLAVMLLSAVFLFAFAVNCAADSAKDLNDGVALFNKGRYDDALDKFIDVMMHGSAQQSSVADEYVNKIHNKMGNIEEPRFVPAAQSAAEEAQIKIDQEVNAVTTRFQDAVPALAPVVQSAPAAPVVAQSVNNNEIVAYNPLTGAASVVYINPDGSVTTTPIITAPVLAQTPQAQEAAPQAAPDYYLGVDPYSSQARTLRAQLTDEKIIAWRDDVIARLQKTPGVKLHMRAGLPDALDIEPGVLFDASSKFLPKAKQLVDDVYTLLLLSSEPVFTVLPAHSYTQDIGIKDVKQAMYFSSAMVSKGLSPAKISYNMGLSHEAPADKFSNLDGLGVVFDYNTAPALKMPEAQQTPLMSLAIAPVNQQARLDDKDGFLMDFSVLETQAPVDKWRLQLIQHNADCKFYVIRQIEGYGPVYAQAFSNGRKMFFGEKLPPGRYTAYLTAEDTSGSKRALRRTITLLDAEGKPAKAYCGAAPVPTVTGATGKVSYKDGYLWNKAARLNVNALMQPGAAAPAQQPAAQTAAPANTPAYEETLYTYPEGNQIPYPGNMPTDEYLPPAGVTQTTNSYVAPSSMPTDTGAGYGAGDMPSSIPADGQYSSSSVLDNNDFDVWEE